MDESNFKQIPYAPLYEVNENGVVRNIKTKSINRYVVSPKGYLRHKLVTPNGRKWFLQHRLVIETFLGIQEGMTVNHKNKIKTDNRLENLEWLSNEENIRYSPARKIKAFNKEKNHVIIYHSISSCNKICKITVQNYIKYNKSKDGYTFNYI